MEMQDKRQENIQEDKKFKGKFWIALLISVVLGFFVGMGSSRLMEYGEVNGLDIPVLLKQLAIVLRNACHYILIVMNLIILPIIGFRYTRHKQEVRMWDGEDEEIMEQLDKKLGIDLAFTTMIIMCSFIVYGIAFYMIPTQDVGVIHIIDIIVLIVSVLIALFQQKAIVNLVKEMNPEKYGSVYDFKFSKKWLESCDELEKQKIGEVSYKTYSVMNAVYLVMALLIALVGFLAEIGILPLLIIGILWITHVMIYLINSNSKK